MILQMQSRAMPVSMLTLHAALLPDILVKSKRTAQKPLHQQYDLLQA